MKEFLLNDNMNVEIDAKAQQVFITVFGEHVVRLPFKDIHAINEACKEETMSRILAFYEKVCGEQ